MNNKTPREMRAVEKRGYWTSIINIRKRVESSPGFVDRKQRKKHRGLANKERCWPIGGLFVYLYACVYWNEGLRCGGSRWLLRSCLLSWWVSSWLVFLSLAGSGFIKTHLGLTCRSLSSSRGIPASRLVVRW